MLADLQRPVKSFLEVFCCPVAHPSPPPEAVVILMWAVSTVDWEMLPGPCRQKHGLPLTLASSWWRGAPEWGSMAPNLFIAFLLSFWT